MTIKTRASLQSFFQRGDRPTSAQFSDLINSCIMLRANGSAVQTGIYEVESTASTTAIPVGNFARTFIGVNTTAQAQAFMAFTSASGAGGGAFGQDWLNANTTADAAPLLGSFIASNVLVSAGDILYTDGSGLQRLPVGTTGQSLFIGEGTASPSWADRITSGTEQNATGTAIDFTDIPSWVKRITIMFFGVSTNGTSRILIRLGDSGGVETTGYLGAVTDFGASSVATEAPVTNGFAVERAVAATHVLHGAMTLVLEDAVQDTWIATGQFARSESMGHALSTGSKSLSTKLDRIQITTAGGTDEFDAGSINIQYE